MKSLLVEAVDQLEATDAVRVIVLVGSDCGAFSTGSDLKGIAHNFDNGVDIPDLAIDHRFGIREFERWQRSLQNHPAIFIHLR